MNNLLVTTFIALTILNLSLSLYGPNSSVVKLTAANFDKEVVNSNELWLVEFYAPWCGHCKNLAPEWEKAANALKGIVKVGAIDMDAEKSFGSKYGIRGFPTIKWFGTKKANPKPYEGQRTAQALVDFAVDKVKQITSFRLSGKADSGANTNTNSNQNTKSDNKQQQKKASASSDRDVIVLTDDNFQSNVFNSKDMWLVEFYAPWCGHCKNLEPQWNIAAAELKGKIKVAKVDATVHSKLASRYGVNGYPTIKIFPPGEKKDSLVEDYNGGRESEQIVATALEKLEQYGYIPDIDQLTNPNQYKEVCEDSGRTCILAFLPNLFDSTAEQRNQYLDTFKKSSTVGRGKPINFLWAQGGDFFDYEEKMGLSFGYPAVLIVNHGKKKYSVMRSAYELQNLKTYYNRILIGKEAFYDIPNMLPKLKSVAAWDGQDVKQDL